MGERQSSVWFLSDVSKELGIAPWRINHAIRAGHVPEVPMRRGRRLFSPEDVTRLREFFAERFSRKAGSDSEGKLARAE